MPSVESFGDMTERNHRVFGLPLVAAFPAVTAISFFLCLSSQGRLGLTLMTADLTSFQLTAQNDVQRSTRRANLTLTDVVRRLPDARLIAEPDTTASVRLASLEESAWQKYETPHLPPFQQPMKPATTQLVPFETAPFPAASDNDSGHRTNYSDNRVLAAHPEGFQRQAPGRDDRLLSWPSCDA